MALTGDKLVAMQTVQDRQDTSGTTTSTTYTATLSGGTACGRAFVAPPSGQVAVANNVSALNSAANFSLCSFVVRTGGTVGSGTLIQAADDATAVTIPGTAEMGMCQFRLVTGLTPGSTYNVQQAFRATAGMATFERKEIVVLPQP